MKKPMLTPKQIRVLELATDVLERVQHSTNEILHEQAERALEDVRCIRDNFGSSTPLAEEP